MKKVARMLTLTGLFILCTWIGFGCGGGGGGGTTPTPVPTPTPDVKVTAITVDQFFNVDRGLGFIIPITVTPSTAKITPVCTSDDIVDVTVVRVGSDCVVTGLVVGGGAVVTITVGGGISTSTVLSTCENFNGQWDGTSNNGQTEDNVTIIQKNCEIGTFSGFDRGVVKGSDLTFDTRIDGTTLVVKMENSIFTAVETFQTLTTLWTYVPAQ